MMIVTSDEFWISDRNLSSLRRTAPSASSFCSMVAPAMRITKKRTNAPMMVMAVAWASGSLEGIQSCQMHTWPRAMPVRLHITTDVHARDPHLAITSRAMKA
jgi:hypothetical protein